MELDKSKSIIVVGHMSNEIINKVSLILGLHDMKDVVIVSTKDKTEEGLSIAEMQALHPEIQLVSIGDIDSLKNIDTLRNTQFDNPIPYVMHPRYDTIVSLNTGDFSESERAKRRKAKQNAKKAMKKANKKK